MLKMLFDRYTNKCFDKDLNEWLESLDKDENMHFDNEKNTSKRSNKYKTKCIDKFMFQVSVVT